MNTSTVTPTVSDPGGYEISALKVGKSVNGFNGTVITVWDGIKSTLDKSTPPHPKLIKSSRVFCVTLSHGNSEILMFAFDEWADAFSRLQIQTEMSFRCHHYVVFANASIPGNSPTASGVCLVISDQTMTSLCEVRSLHISALNIRSLSNAISLIIV